MEIVWTEEALEDLSTIYKYREQPTAKRHIKKILSEVNTLRIFPEAGPVHLTPNTKKEFRALVVAKGMYKVAYYLDIKTNNVVVMRIFDCRQDPENLKLK